MSAFIVQDDTINRIVTFILNDNGRRNLNHYFRLAGYDLMADPEAAERLAIDLHLMNCDAVDERYSKGTAAHDVKTCFEFRRKLCPSTVDSRFQIFRHAKCLLYQCAEGDVPDRPLYCALEKFAAQLAESIIDSMPQMEACSWS